MDKDNIKHISIELSLRVYPMDAVYGACHRFIDKFYLFLDKPTGGRIEVNLVPKASMNDTDLKSCAGEFANELLHQSLRLRIANKTSAVREMILGRALLSAEPVQNDEELCGQELSDRKTNGGEAAFDPDYLDDPLGIAVPWEEKFSGQNDDAASSKESSEEESP